MKYSFKTSGREPATVTIDRAILSGKVKVYVNDKPVGPSHQGRRGAAGTFYPVGNTGTLEVRSSMFELVPSAWYNDDWVDLVPPLKGWQYLLIALPLLSTIAITFGQLLGLVVGVVAVLASYVVMRSQRPANVRVMISVIIAIIAPIIGVVLIVAVGSLTSAR